MILLLLAIRLHLCSVSNPNGCGNSCSGAICYGKCAARFSVGAATHLMSMSLTAVQKLPPYIPNTRHLRLHPLRRICCIIPALFMTYHNDLAASEHCLPLCWYVLVCSNFRLLPMHHRENSRLLTSTPNIFSPSCWY